MNAHPIFVKNQWVTNDSQIGKVKEVYTEDGLIDIVLYSREGEKIGRESEALGGPTTFEPCCSMEGWKLIKKPEFPLKRCYYLTELLEYL